MNSKKPYPFHKSNNPLLEDANQLDIFKGKSFLEFNDIIGLPEKNNIEHAIYDYELDVVSKIENNRNIWIKKASGIGATTLLLRYLTWKILVNDDLEYKNIFIISGTHVRHANDVKIKMEDLFRKRFPLIRLESKFTDLWIKNTNIKIFPSRNVKDLNNRRKLPRRIKYYFKSHDELARRDSTFSYDDFVNYSIEELRKLSFQGGGSKTPGIWRDKDGKLRDKFGQLISPESGNKEAYQWDSIKIELSDTYQ